MSRIDPIRTKKDLIVFLIVIALCPIIVWGKSGGDFMVAMSITIGVCFAYAVVSLPSWISMRHGAMQILNRCKKYIEENKVKIGLFVRSSLNKHEISLANKYCVVSFNISRGLNNVKILDKVSGQEKIMRINKTFYDLLTSKNTHDLLTGLFFTVCANFDYDITAEEIEEKCKGKHPFLYKWKMKTKKYKNLSLDINQASEAELTALPGVTIAKAKHAVKMRKKYAFYISMNQFYEAINLEEEFIEQIQTNGNKVLLSELPEYKKLEMKREL